MRLTIATMVFFALSVCACTEDGEQQTAQRSANDFASQPARAVQKAKHVNEIIQQDAAERRRAIEQYTH